MGFVGTKLYRKIGVKMKKILKIIFLFLINITLLVGLLFLSDFIIYKVNSDPIRYFDEHPLSTDIPKFQYLIKDPFITYVNLDGYFDGENNIF